MSNDPVRYDRAPTLIPRGMVNIGECGKYVLWTDYSMLKAELAAERERRVAAEEVVDAPPGMMSPYAYQYRRRYPKGDDHG